MTDLLCYRGDEVTAIAGAIGADSPPVLAALRFRDPQGAYWTISPATRTAYRFAGGEWTPAPLPAGPFEAPEYFRDLTVRSIPRPAARPEPTGNANAVDVVRECVRDARDAYRAGSITSGAAEMLLGRLAVRDHEGRFWTLGARSERWYVWSRSGWSAATPPDSIGYPEEAEPSEDSLRMAVEFVVEGDGALPEPLTDPWAPPPGAPGRFCRACGAPLGAQFCTGCGAQA